MMQVLVLGVGNTLMADDGVGPAAIALLEERWTFPENVTLTDGGTKGALLLPLVQECTHLLVLDAIDMKAVPGTLYKLDENDLKCLWADQPTGVHDASIPHLLAYTELLDCKPQEVRAIGVQPDIIALQAAELSKPVENALPDVCSAVIECLENWGISPVPQTATAAGANFRPDSSVPRISRQAESGGAR